MIILHFLYFLQILVVLKTVILKRSRLSWVDDDAVSMLRKIILLEKCVLTLIDINNKEDYFYQPLTTECTDISSAIKYKEEEVKKQRHFNLWERYDVDSLQAHDDPLHLNGEGDLRGLSSIFFDRLAGKFLSK